MTVAYAEDVIIEKSETLDYNTKSVEINGNDFDIPETWMKNEVSDSRSVFMSDTGMVSFEYLENPGVSLDNPMLVNEIKKSFEQDESMNIKHSELVEIEDVKALRFELQAPEFLSDESSEINNGEIIIIKVEDHYLMAMRLLMDDTLSEEIVKEDQQKFYDIVISKLQ